MGISFKAIILLVSINYCVFADQQEAKNIDEVLKLQKKSEELRALKKAMQAEKIKREQEVFNSLQTYGRSIVDLALIVMIAKPNSKKEKIISTSCFSTQEKMLIAKSSLSWFLILVEIARIYHGYNEHKKMIESLTYQDFLQDYPELVIALYHISIMKTLIELSISGAFPQQVFARIQLVKMSLPPPYDKYANKCSYKLFKHSFHQNGCFKWVEIGNFNHPYKKFYKKVPQDFKGVAYYASSFPEVICEEYVTPQEEIVSNDYNDRLISIVYAGIKQDKDFLKELSQKYKDGLIQKMCRYYLI